MQDQFTPYRTGADEVSAPVDLNTEQPVQNFAFGGIANPTQRVFLRGSDKTFLDARQKELDEFEKQRQAYNDALTKWQTEVYNPYAAQVTAYNEAAQRYNTDIYNPYKAQVDAYNAALEQYNREVYDPYAQQYAAYEQAVNAYNAGDRTSDYAGPEAPTLARNFDMTLPAQPGAFDMTAPTAPADFSMERPVLPFNEEEVVAYQQAAAERARKDASNRAAAIDVVSNPEQFNFGAMSVSNRFMAKGGPVEKDTSGQARKMMDDLSAPEDDAALMRMLSELTSNGKLSQDQILSAVDRVAASGRGGDELLAYLSPESVAVLKRMGGAGTINPATGLPEFKGGVVGRIGRGIRRLFGRRDRPAVAAEQQGAAEAAAPEVAAPAPVEAAAPTSPTAAELLQQVEDANAARRAAEEQLAARTTELTSFQEQAGTRTQEAVDAALRADAERRATTIAQPVIGAGQITASDMLGQVDRASRMMDPMSPDFVGPRTSEQQAAFDAAQRTPTLNDAIARLRENDKTGAEAIMRQIVGLPPLEQTTTPAPTPTPAPAPAPSVPTIRMPAPVINPATPVARAPGSVSPIGGTAPIYNPVMPTVPGQLAPGSSVQPLDPEFLRNIARYDPATRRALIEGQRRDMERGPYTGPDVSPWMPTVRDSTTPVDEPSRPTIGGGIGPIGSIGAIPIGGVSTPTTPMFGGSPSTGRGSPATSPSSYFARSQPAFQGGMPGTISAPYNPMAQYTGALPQDLIAVNPNLSPAMLGGQQNAGMMTDRLGNRIYAPGAMPLFGFAKGGSADVSAMRALVDASNMAEDEEGPTVDDYAGEARRMLDQVQPQAAAPQMRTPRLPQSAGGAQMPKEMGGEALTTRQDFKPKKAKSAKAELKALAKQYALKQRAVDNQSKGLMRNTLGAPTLEQPTLTDDSLTVRRFKDGGEARKMLNGLRPKGFYDGGEAAGDPGGGDASGAVGDSGAAAAEAAGLDTGTSGIANDAAAQADVSGAVAGGGELGALAQAISLGLSPTGNPVSDAQVAQAVANAQAGSLSPANMATLASAGLGPAVGFNINNPTQSIDEMLAAQNVGNLLSYAVPGGMVAKGVQLAMDAYGGLGGSTPSPAPAPATGGGEGPGTGGGSGPAPEPRTPAGAPTPPGLRQPVYQGSFEGANPVWGPDGQFYPSAMAALQKGVTGYTFTPPPYVLSPTTPGSGAPIPIVGPSAPRMFAEGGAVYRGPKRERGVDAKGRAKVSKEELADFKRLYGQDKTLRDLLNADRAGRAPDVPSELDPRARGLQGANVAPGPTSEQLAQYEAMMRPGRDAIEPMIGPEGALLGGPASARALLAALRGARRPREEPSRREPTMSRQELDALMQRMQGEGRETPKFAKGGSARARA